jgi:hypothetical protein
MARSLLQPADRNVAERAVGRSQRANLRVALAQEQAGTEQVLNREVR